MSPEEHVGPPAERTVVERPPPGLARGKYPVPAAVVVALGAAIVALGVGFLWLRIWRRR